ncbi:hypothetical protein TrVFT333_011079 [Trichoderma virens FT-333]|nr:hypothetical protein TrVFT333_011079 [Trichoderma virens FT-333]
MDVLLSVPIFSYLLGPTLTSWSTSLNLLFFYMTWSTLVLSQPPIVVHITGILAIRIVFFLIPSLLTLFFDVSLPSLAEGIKHGGRSALPPRDAKSLAKLLGLVLLNLVILTAVEAGISFAFIFFLKQPVFKTTTTLPSHGKSSNTSSSSSPPAKPSYMPSTASSSTGNHIAGSPNATKTTLTQRPARHSACVSSPTIPCHSFSTALSHYFSRPSSYDPIFLRTSSFSRSAPARKPSPCPDTRLSPASSWAASCNARPFTTQGKGRRIMVHGEFWIGSMGQVEAGMYLKM